MKALSLSLLLVVLSACAAVPPVADDRLAVAQVRALERDWLDAYVGYDIEAMRQLLADGELDVVTFTSSSTVRHTVNLLGDDALKLLSNAAVASIGPITSDTARELGLDVSLTAGEYTVPGLVQALHEHFESDAVS